MKFIVVLQPKGWIANAAWTTRQKTAISQSQLPPPPLLWL